ncbi:MAG TPA: nitrilase-related carbon-nitrogen hydrolase, partial [Enhygromyxa sp.]|nr:nitrilase-related carbon-nitrogen hydrolase [Enhygromyxa sp.]
GQGNAQIEDAEAPTQRVDPVKVKRRQLVGDAPQLLGLGVAILGGTAPRSTDAGIVNTAMLAFPNGQRVLQDKLFLTPDEAAWGWTTGDSLQVFDTPWGRSTMLICYDSQFPSLSHQLGEAAPELLLIPSMTCDKGLFRVRWSAQARAIEHHAYVVVVGTVDAHASAAGFHGQAVVLTPQDSGFAGVLAEGPRNREAIVHAKLDLAQLRRSRIAAGLYAARDQAKRAIPKLTMTTPECP